MHKDGLCQSSENSLGILQDKSEMIRTKLALSKLAIISLSAMSLTGFALSVQAANLVTNGDFETTTNGIGQFDYQGRTATGWTSTNANNNAYNFIFGAGTADTTGVSSQYGNLKLWGPNDGSANGLTATSPTAGNFVGADGAFQQGAISQTINGLTVSKSYTVGFWWAGAQQSGFDGITTDQWQVSLGSQIKFTPVLTNASHGFTGWRYQTFDFIASNTSAVLSFLAIGTPNGLPPFSLLDGVTLDATIPEPAVFLPAVLLAGGMLGLRLARKQ